MEAMDLKALLESLTQIEQINERRLKMMKEVKLTEFQVQELRPKPEEGEENNDL